jgi:hypothetical protein
LFLLLLPSAYVPPQSPPGQLASWFTTYKQKRVSRVCEQRGKY